MPIMINTIPNIDQWIHAANKADGFVRSNRITTDIFSPMLNSRYILLRKSAGRFDESFLKHLKNTSCELFDDGVHITRTLDYQYNGGGRYAYLLQDRAPGDDMLDITDDPKLLKKFANQPVQTYFNFIADYVKIQNKDLSVDDAFSNLFFWPSAITFIDINPQKNPLLNPMPNDIMNEFIKMILQNNPRLYADHPDVTKIKSKLHQAVSDYSK